MSDEEQIKLLTEIRGLLREQNELSRTLVAESNALAARRMDENNRLSKRIQAFWFIVLIPIIIGSAYMIYAVWQVRNQ